MPAIIEQLPRSLPPAAETVALTHSEDLEHGHGRADAMVRVIEEWHNTTPDHTGAFVTCPEQPCHAIGRLAC